VKAAWFGWDSASKRWTRRMDPDEVPALPFLVVADGDEPRPPSKRAADPAPIEEQNATLF
jgi:hypothetical protein